MKPTTTGAGCSILTSAEVFPELAWLPIADLVLEPAYMYRLQGAGRAVIDRIAKQFSWSCFLPVVVTPRDDGKFAVIDGHRRTTAAAAVGVDKVPCQIVHVGFDQRSRAFTTINGKPAGMTRMGLLAAGLATNESHAVKLSTLCAQAEVHLLRYPVPVERQVPGQTMAVGAITQCYERYGEATLITALQCVTQTANNKPGMLSARLIKALCSVLAGNSQLRDSGLALLEAFDAIDLAALQDRALSSALTKKISPVREIADRIRQELGRLTDRPVKLERRKRVRRAGR